MHQIANTSVRQGYELACVYLDCTLFFIYLFIYIWGFFFSDFENAIKMVAMH